MNSKSREELVEQYEDAAFALLMSEYAEQEGKRLLKEFEEAKAKGEVPEVPAALDAKCRKMIRQAYEKKRRKGKAKRFLQTVGRVAAMLFITLGVCTTLVFSVEALRMSVINFLIEHHERYTSIDFDKEMTDAPMQDTNLTTSGDASPLDVFIPTNYELYKYTVKSNGSVSVIYKSKNGGNIVFTTTVCEGNLNLDTEDANGKKIEIAGYQGLQVEKDSILKITWFDTEKCVAYQLRADALNKTEFWALAESIAKADIGGALCAEE